MVLQFSVTTSWQRRLVQVLQVMQQHLQ